MYLVGSVKKVEIFNDLCKKPRKRRLLYILQLYTIIKSSRFLIFFSLVPPIKHGLPDVVSG